MMTQLLVPMTYAEQLEQELIRAEKERAELLQLICSAVNCAYDDSNSFGFVIPYDEFCILENVALNK